MFFNYFLGSLTEGGSLYAIPLYHMEKYFMTNKKYTEQVKIEDEYSPKSWVPSKPRGVYGEIEIHRLWFADLEINPKKTRL